MNKISNALIAALVFSGSISNATAHGVITKIEATGTDGGTDGGITKRRNNKIRG